MKKYVLNLCTCVLFLTVVPNLMWGQTLIKRYPHKADIVQLEPWQQVKMDSVEIRPGYVFWTIKDAEGNFVKRMLVRKYNTLIGGDPAWGQGVFSGKIGGLRGLAGRVKGYGNCCLPYARVSFIDGKDTTVLTCDAMGGFLWRTKRVPDTLWIHTEAAGYRLKWRFVQASQSYNNWLLIATRQILNRVNEVIVFSDKVQLVINGDTLEHRVPPISAGDINRVFVDSLLKNLPGASMKDGTLTVNGEPMNRLNLDSFGTVHEFIKKEQIKDLEEIKQEEKRQKSLRKEAKRRRAGKNSD